jgi:Mg-chelatase subunit ChlD
MQYNYSSQTTPMAVATVVPDSDGPIAIAVPDSSLPDSSQYSRGQRTDARPDILNQGRSKRVLVPQPSSKQLSNDETLTLKDQGYTSGLIKSIARSNVTFPLRIWIVDNSGSMMNGDGHRLVETGYSNDVKFVSCTRWAEIQETVEYHIQIAALLGAPTVFRLMNDPGKMVGPQQFSIGERGPDFIPEDVNLALNTIRAASPIGVTPLSDHVREIRENVMAMRDGLMHQGQRVVIILATDGLPSNNYGVSNSGTLKEFKDCLRSLEGLPVWIVVRLCTDEDQVVDFYNDLDCELELSLEVIDDFVGEAEEIYEYNKWLNYALPLHRIREMGFSHKLFDLLDERALTKDELRQFFLLMFGEASLDGTPDPQVDWEGFLKCIDRIANREKKQWNPMKKRMSPWVDTKRLNSVYGDSSCTIM